MNLRHHTLTALLCLPLLLTGCSEDKESEPEANPPVTSAAATTPSDSPTVEPRGEQSEAGIRAFIEHWAELISAASVTGDTEQLDAMAQDGCRSCNAVSDYLRDLYADGGRLETTEYRVLQVGQLPAGASLRNPMVATTIRKPREVVFRHGKRTVIPTARQAYQFDLVWSGKNWRIAQMGLIE